MHRVINTRGVGGKALIGMVAMLSGWAMGGPVGADDFPACTSAIKEAPILAADEAQVNVSVKWCGLNGSPAIDDPSLVGEDNFKDVLWRRHERASECIWIPQCRLTLRSGGAVQKEDYERFDDPDPAAGNAGDVVIHRDCDENGENCVKDYDVEWRPVIDLCDQLWEDQPKGLVAVSINRFITDQGTVVGVHGVALSSSLSRPALAVVDPTATNADNERVLAHEAGHKFGLCHTNGATCSDQLDGDPDNLMRSNVPNGLLTEDQCLKARDVVQGNDMLDPPDGPAGRVDFVRDATGEVAGFIDIYKVVGVDRTPVGGGLILSIGTEGTAEGNDATYWIALDIDNDPTTGLSTAGFVTAPSAFAGVELILRALVSTPDTVDAVQVFEASNGGFVERLLGAGQLTAVVRVVEIREIGPEADPDPVPLFLEVDFLLSPPGLAALGIEGGDEQLFPGGLRLQAAADTHLPDGGDQVDLGPDTGGVLDFPRIDFPEVRIVGDPCPGQRVRVEAAGLAPNRRVRVFLGDSRLDVEATTDAAGAAQFTVQIPDDQGAGPTLLTVGVVGEDNAVTGDLIVNVCPRPRFGSAWAAKVVCGTQRNRDDLRLARGVYATTINIHNPADREAILTKELALTFPPEEQRPGEVFFIAEDRLPAGRALEVSCNDLRRRLFPDGFPESYLEGFVRLRSTESLDVVAVYSTAALGSAGGRGAAGTGPHSSIDVEQVPERRVDLPADEFADLIPQPALPPPPSPALAGAPGFGFCVASPQGGAAAAVRVRVRNLGPAAAGPSSLRVEFEGAADGSVPVPPLAPGGQTAVQLSIPPGCYPPGFSGQCRFRVTADADAQVQESNEANNGVSGFCSAPAG